MKYIIKRNDLYMRKSLLATYVKMFLVILIIIAVVYGGIKIFSNGKNKMKYETVKTNMLLIQGKTKVIAQKVSIKEKDAKYIGIAVKERQEDEKIKNLISNSIININSKDSNLYCVDNSGLKEMGLENIKIDDYYIVDYKKNDVIYVDGIENQDGKVIYKLSEMQ